MRVLLSIVTVVFISLMSSFVQAQERPALNSDSSRYLSVQQFEEDAQTLLDFMMVVWEDQGQGFNQDDPDFLLWASERLYVRYLRDGHQILGEPSFKQIP